MAAPIQTLFPVLNERVGVEYPLPALVRASQDRFSPRMGENHRCAVPATLQRRGTTSSQPGDIIYNIPSRLVIPMNSLADNDGVTVSHKLVICSAPACLTFLFLFQVGSL